MRINIKLYSWRVAVALAWAMCGVRTGYAQATAFIYQGQLINSNRPADGSYDITFTLFGLNQDGFPVGPVLTNLNTPVSAGLFSASLDFGAVFNGSNYWLEIAVRTNGDRDFTVLQPRQTLMPVPYAVFSANAGTAITALSANTAASAVSVPASGIVGAITLSNGAFSGAVTATNLYPDSTPNNSAVIWNNQGAGNISSPAAAILQAPYVPDVPFFTSGCLTNLGGGLSAGDIQLSGYSFYNNKHYCVFNTNLVVYTNDINWSNGVPVTLQNITLKSFFPNTWPASGGAIMSGGKVNPLDGRWYVCYTFFTNAPLDFFHCGSNIVFVLNSTNLDYITQYPVKQEPNAIQDLDFLPNGQAIVQFEGTNAFSGDQLHYYSTNTWLLVSNQPMDCGVFYANGIGWNTFDSRFYMIGASLSPLPIHLLSHTPASEASVLYKCDPLGHVTEIASLTNSSPSVNGGYGGLWCDPITNMMRYTVNYDAGMGFTNTITYLPLAASASAFSVWGDGISQANNLYVTQLRMAGSADQYGESSFLMQISNGLPQIIAANGISISQFGQANPDFTFDVSGGTNTGGLYVNNNVFAGQGINANMMRSTNGFVGGENYTFALLLDDSGQLALDLTALRVPTLNVGPLNGPYGFGLYVPSAPSGAEMWLYDGATRTVDFMADGIGSLSSNLFVAETIFANYLTVTNRINILSDGQQIGDSGGALVFFNPTSTQFNFGGSSFGASDGLVNAGTFNGAFTGNAAGATNLQQANIIFLFNTNNLTTSSLVQGDGSSGAGAAITNWNVSFATNVYDLWISNSICISNCLNLVSNVNSVQIFFHNTNAAATYYLSFAGNPTLAGGLTNGWPITNSLGDYWLQGTIVGTNWQTNTAHWALLNPNY